MSDFLRTVVTQDATLTASVATDLIDLPVNPMSHVLLTLRALNNAADPDDYRAVQPFYDRVTKVEVLYRGQQIIEGSLEDLTAAYAAILGYLPGQVNKVNTDNNRRAATFILPFGRRLFSMTECFPATQRGEFQIRITSGADPTGMDTFTYQIETVELLNASPERFVKVTSFTGTGTSTGELDRDLPRGNPILGVLLFGTTIDTAAAGVNTVETVKVLVDNVERFYSRANWETLHGELARRIPQMVRGFPHIHNVDIADATGTDRDSREDEDVMGTLENYALLDFDPTMDSEFALQTEGTGRVHLRIDYGDTNAMRFLPFELMGVVAT